jgi:hypothetical protein
VLYVRAGASGGDGSAAAPFGTIGAAVAAASNGTTIALNGATFPESVTLPAGVTLLGACAEKTVIAPASGIGLSAPGGGAVRDLTIEVTSGIGLGATGGALDVVGVAVRGGMISPALLANGATALSAHRLVVSGGSPGIQIDGSATASIGTALITGSVMRGVNAIGSATVDLFDTAIDGTLATPEAPATGLAATAQASVELSRSSIEGVQGAGVDVSDFGSLSLSDLVVRAIRSSADRTHGFGLNANAGRLEGRRIWVRQARNVGITAYGPVELDLADVVVTDTFPEESDALYGLGMVIAGARATLARIWLERNHDTGLSVQGATTGTASDLTVRSTLVRLSDGGAGAGILLLDGSSLVLLRAQVLENQARGIDIYGGGSTLVASDVEIADTLADAPQHGQGIAMGAGGRLSGARIQIERGSHAGLDVSGLTTTASVSDLEVRGTVALDGDDAERGAGVVVTASAQFTARCVSLDATQSFGLLVEDAGSLASLTDLTVRGTLPPTNRSGPYGRGIGVELGASLIAQRVLVSETSGANIATLVGTALTSSEVSTASISDATLSLASARACSGPGCPDISDAIGVRVSIRSSLRLNRFTITDEANAGVVIDPGANVRLADGTIGGSPIGVELTPTPDAPLSAIADHVEFMGDGINAALPAPPSIQPP